MIHHLYVKRIQRGWTQEELARVAGVSRRTVNALESTGRYPSLQVGLRLCRALECRMEEVFPCDDVL